MILRMLSVVLVLGSCFTSVLYAGSERGGRIISEAGGVAGVPGVAGIPGVAGAAGVGGLIGLPGSVLDFSDFYALMPTDNGAPVAAGVAVAFPNGSPGNFGGITALTSSTFQLAAVGTYLVMFQVSVSEAGQLMLRLNGGLLPNTVVGRATGTSQIIGMSYVTTSAVNSVLEVINPPGNTPALTITPDAGGATAVSAHLTIVRIQ